MLKMALQVTMADRSRSNILQLPDEWPDDETADDNELERFAEASRSALRLSSALWALKAMF